MSLNRNLPVSRLITNVTVSDVNSFFKLVTKDEIIIIKDQPGIVVFVPFSVVHAEEQKTIPAVIPAFQVDSPPKHWSDDDDGPFPQLNKATFIAKASEPVKKTVGVFGPICSSCGGVITGKTHPSESGLVCIGCNDVLKKSKKETKKKSEDKPAKGGRWCRYRGGQSCPNKPGACKMPHKLCNWAMNCSVRTCHLVHPEGWDPEIASGELPKGKRHPSKCDYGDDCDFPNCYYTHPRDVKQVTGDSVRNDVSKHE